MNFAAEVEHWNTVVNLLLELMTVKKCTARIEHVIRREEQIITNKKLKWEDNVCSSTTLRGEARSQNVDNWLHWYAVSQIHYGFSFCLFSTMFIGSETIKISSISAAYDLQKGWNGLNDPKCSVRKGEGKWKREWKRNLGFGRFSIICRKAHFTQVQYVQYVWKSLKQV